MDKIHNNHGDLILKPVDAQTPPESAVKSNLHILQQSSVTQNRHEVVGKDIYYWKTEDGREFIQCDTDYKIQHVGGDEEHGVQPVQAGTREVLHELEHDPWKNELRAVID